MRHVQVTRVVWGVTGVFVAAAAVFALSGGPSGARSGAALFDAQCGRCHGAGAVAGWAEVHPDPEARADWLDGVLRNHFPPPEDERAMIIDHIQQAIAEAGE